ncbi:MAG: hypothetical protein R2817_02250 [Flavobacteriales bacterium]
MNRTLYAFLLFGISAPTALAQCPAGEVEVTIDVLTDAYGNETYWELVEGTAPCGTDAIFVGGNPALDCTDGNTGLSIAGGYANNITVSEGPWCLVQGVNHTIHSVDSYGDGHASFTVFVNDVPTASFSGQGANLQHVFTALPPQEIDLSVTRLTTALYGEEGSPITVRGVLSNLGGTTVQSLTLNYRIDGGAVVSESMEGLTLNAGGTFEFAHSTDWVPSGTGTVELEVWASNINGGEDQAPANDVRTISVKVFPPIPDRMAEYLVGEPILTVVADDDEDLLVPRDLDFHPDRDRNELWVINKDVAQSGGSTVRFFAPGGPEMTFLWQRDPNAWHFMSLPTAIAMGDNGNFATSPGIFDANQNGGDPFTGPTLWSADPAIYAQNQFGPLGSHLDMLHVNPRSQGIAHDHWNRYWVVDGHNGDVVMNDFREDHGPGQSYHGDALIRRYDAFTITRDPNDHVVSHCVMDKNTGWLYVVDHGGQRVLRMDTRGGTNAGAATFGPWESYVEYTRVVGYDWEVIVDEGLVGPAGIDLVGDHMIVSDHTTGDIVIYDLSGAEVAEVGRIATGTPGIMGVKVGPNGRIWYVNATTHALVRVDPSDIVGVEEQPVALVRAFPSPTADVLYVQGIAGRSATVRDLTGRTCMGLSIMSDRQGIDVSGLGNGTYLLHVDGVPATSFVVQH